ncbi:hypothetical protein KEM56_006108, partial [Ascosphaera pollenicola]
AKPSQLIMNDYDWDVMVHAFFWMYHGGYRTPSEKHQEKSSTEGSAAKTLTPEELQMEDLKLHFGILKLSKEYKIEQLEREARSSILDMIKSKPDIKVLVEFCRQLHSEANDEELVAFAATEAAERREDLIKCPEFSTLWMPGSFYKNLLHLLPARQAPKLPPITPYKRKSGDTPKAPSKRAPIILVTPDRK